MRQIVARDALLLVDDGDAAAGDAVEERGLADVGTPDERDRGAPRGGGRRRLRGGVWRVVVVHAAGL